MKTCVISLFTSFLKREFKKFIESIKISLLTARVTADTTSLNPIRAIVDAYERSMTSLLLSLSSLLSFGGSHSTVLLYKFEMTKNLVMTSNKFFEM